MNSAQNKKAPDFKINQEKFSTAFDARLKDFQDFFSEHEHAKYALLFYFLNVKDDKKAECLQKIRNLLSNPSETQLFVNKLEGKTFGTESDKPDCYILERGGRIVCEYSYHYLRKVIKEKYGSSIHCALFNEHTIKSIKAWDPVLCKIKIDDEEYFTQSLNYQQANPEQILAVVVTETKTDSSIRQLLIYKDAIEKSASTYGAQRKFLSQKTSAGTHKEIQMLKKTCIRMFVKEFFEDVLEISDTNEFEEDYTLINSKPIPARKNEGTSLSLEALEK